MLYTTAGSVVTAYVDTAKAVSGQSKYGQKMPLPSPTFGGSSTGILNTILSVILPGYSSLITMLQSIIGLSTAQQSNANPVILLALMGSGLLDAAFKLWILTGAILVGLTAGMSFCPSVTASTSVVAFTTWVAPFMTIMITGMFAMGALLAYYIPFIPFVVFLFTSLGWFVAVIESMIAAPLVALGLAYPEGQHELFGHAQASIFLIVNVFLRPMLMIFGFIGGIILAYIGVWLLNDGFGYVSSAMITNLGSLAAYIFAPFALLIIYTTLVLTVVNKAFSLIHILPDKVTRWLGGGGETFGSEFAGAAGEVKQAAQQQLGAPGGAMAQGVGKGSERASQKGAEREKADEAARLQAGQQKQP